MSRRPCRVRSVLRNASRVPSRWRAVIILSVGRLINTFLVFCARSFTLDKKVELLDCRVTLRHPRRNCAGISRLGLPTSCLDRGQKVRRPGKVGNHPSFFSCLMGMGMGRLLKIERVPQYRWGFICESMMNVNRYFMSRCFFNTALVGRRTLHIYRTQTLLCEERTGRKKSLQIHKKIFQNRIPNPIEMLWCV